MRALLFIWFHLVARAARTKIILFGFFLETPQVRLSQRHTLGSTVYCKLGIYSLTASDMHRVAPVVER